MKEFNITGTCIPGEHYMVDTSEKVRQIVELIEKNKYFTINRARQYGKTTTFASIYRQLKDKYTIIRMSFEGLGEETFASNLAFVKFFIKRTGSFLQFLGESETVISKWNSLEELKDSEDAFDVLSRKITSLCRESSQEVLLMIDEVDKSSDNQIFLNFLGMLRNKYLDSKEGFDQTYKSVILAGVYDIKNLKLKIRQDAEQKYNSPWNIAADFLVDMSFSPAEISTMLEEYEQDHHTGMDQDAISEALYFYTDGYPFLVTRLCKWIDEQGGKIWTVENVRNAEMELLHTPCTLFDDLIKNYENHAELQKVIDEILFEGKEYSYVMTDPVIQFGSMLGIFVNKKNTVAISNLIFEVLLYNHIMSKKNREGILSVFVQNHYVENGKLNMPLILEKFQEIMYTEYRKEDQKFIEQQGRLLFLCFLKPIINGTGFYYIEPQTRNNNRMDIVVVYGGEEFIIELKIWHGEQYREKGIRQLEEYLETRNQKTGYLVSFSFLKKKKKTCGWMSQKETSKNIFEVVVDTDV